MKTVRLVSVLVLVFTLFPVAQSTSPTGFPPFASFADIEKEDFSWTRGTPASFHSSSIAMRDFCASCGTPLSFRRIDGPRIEIMTGAFDRPDRVIPTRQYGTESRLGWVVGIANLPSQTTLQNYGPEKLGGIVSHQHPDHD